MKRGFTLIEQMIIIAMLGVMTGSFMLDAYFTHRQPARLEHRMEAVRQETLALELLSRDLRQARAQLHDPLRPEVLSLDLGQRRVDYSLAADRRLVRSVSGTDGRPLEFESLAGPLEQFTFGPAEFQLGARDDGASPGSPEVEVSWSLGAKKYPGMRVFLKGGQGLLASGASVSAAWRGDWQ